MPAASKLLCCVLLLSGCSVINLQGRGESVARVKLSHEIAEFANVRSVEEIDRRLNELCSATDAQQRAELLIEGWGQHGSWYDLVVVKFLWDRWPQKMDNDDGKSDPRRLFETTKTVLNSKPELVCQIFWYFQWSTRVPDFAGMMHDMEPKFTLGCRNTKWDYYWMMLLYAGVASGLPLEYSAGDSAWRADWDGLPGNFFEQKQLILGQRPFLRYDHELGRWIVDQDAKKANRYLTPEEQQASLRPTPLPNWSSDVIPPRPIHEPEVKGEVKLLGIPE